MAVVVGTLLLKVIRFVMVSVLVRMVLLSKVVEIFICCVVIFLMLENVVGNVFVRLLVITCTLLFNTFMVI